MNRIKFAKGEQRKFLEKVILELNCVSLRGLLQFGLDVSYSSLKKYFNELRTLPEGFFDNLCYLAKIERNNLDVEILNSNWGQIIGGKKGK